MAFVYGLSGTLSNPLHRMHLFHARAYEEYYEAFVRDTVNDDVLNHFSRVFDIEETIIVSGMPEEYRYKIEDWLRYNGIYPDALLLRSNSDYSKEGDCKIKLLTDYYLSKEKLLQNVDVVLENDDKVVETLRNAGLVVWQVR